MVALALGLAAGISWGLADFLGGISSRRLRLLTVVGFSQLVGTLLVGALVLAQGEGPPGAGTLAVAAAGGLAGLVGIAALYRGFTVGAMGVVAPISATGAAVPVIVGIAGGERPGALQAAGLVLALAGVVLAARAAPSVDVPSRVAAGAGLALVAALGFGSFFVALDVTGDEGVLWALLAARAADALLLVPLLLVLRPALPAGRRDTATVAAVGVFDVGANGLFALAATKGLVSVVAVLASLYPVVTIVLARVVLRERVRATQRVGVALALAGVAAIAAG